MTIASSCCGPAEPAAVAAAALRVNLINLERSPERLHEFMTVNAHLGTVGRWAAVDGKALDPAALVAEGVVDELVAKGFTSGALGNAMSHLSLWKRVLARGEPVTVSEDDAIFHRDFASNAAAVLARLPADCDIVLWGWNFDSALAFGMLPGVSPCIATFDQQALRRGIADFQSQPVSPHPFRLLLAFGTVCYTIFPAGARALMRLCVPLRGERLYLPALGRTVAHIALDVAMAAVYPQINAYVAFPPLVVTKNDHQQSLTIEQRPAPVSGAPPAPGSSYR